MSAITFTPGVTYHVDISRLYSPAELQAIRQHNDSILQEAIKQEQEDKAQQVREEYEASRLMTDEEYYQYSLEREAEKQRKNREQELILAAQEQARLDFMDSSPPLVEIVESVPVIFLSQLQAWIKKGYMIDLNNVQYFAPGCFAVNLTPSTTN
ncbi:hypothetical protein [Herbaspirillum huttiense]|uniref:hypothetical protein n=1 Tax=Herbaspirillum huttiense TaxID=863372 RepID=UPI0039AF2BBC